jgi:hypothetical protein
LAWAKKLTGPYGNQSRLIETDKAGNIFMLGSFEDTLYVNPANASIYLYSHNDACFIAKFDPTGNTIWSLKIGDPDGQISDPKIRVDTSGNLFVVGLFNGLIDFDPGPGTFTLNAPVGSGFLPKGFMLKFDPGGNFLWVKEFSGMNGGGCLLKSIFVDGKQSVWLCGKFSGAVDFDPGPGTLYMTTPCPNGGCADNGFVLKLDNNGSFRWAKSFMTAPPTGIGSMANDVTVDSLGNGYAVGFAQANSDLDPGQAVYTCSANCGFLCKLDSLGGFVFAKLFYGKCFPGSVVLS